MKKRGIVIAGNIITDIVKNIEMYPEIGKLTYVTDISPAVGGCVPNTAINLAKIDSSISNIRNMKFKAMKQAAIEKMIMFGSAGKA